MAIPMSTGIYKAKTISALTGISATLLRAWEKRYDFLSPARQAGNQRLYSQEDLQVLKVVQALTAEGLSIGEVAALGRQELLKKFWEVEASNSSGDSTTGPSSEPTRYIGKDLGVSVADLTASDLSTIFRLYSVVKGVHELRTYVGNRAIPELILARIKPLSDSEFRRDLRLLGAGQNYREPARLAVRDCREGALLSLFSGLVSEDLELICALARDQAKLMRNALFDLDPPLRGVDEQLHAHDLLTLLDKLRLVVSKATSEYVGPISSCCLEASTLDRIFYEFVNRLPQPIQLYISHSDRVTQWTFYSDAALSLHYRPTDLAVRAVASAFHTSPQQALLDELVGKGCGRAWFCWPDFREGRNLPPCGCKTD